MVNPVGTSTIPHEQATLTPPEEKTLEEEFLEEELLGGEISESEPSGTEPSGAEHLEIKASKEAEHPSTPELSDGASSPSSFGNPFQPLLRFAIRECTMHRVEASGKLEEALEKYHGTPMADLLLRLLFEWERRYPPREYQCKTYSLPFFHVTVCNGLSNPTALRIDSITRRTLYGVIVYEGCLLVSRSNALYVPYKINPTGCVMGIRDGVDKQHPTTIELIMQYIGESAWIAGRFAKVYVEFPESYRLAYVEIDEYSKYIYSMPLKPSPTTLRELLPQSEDDEIDIYDTPPPLHGKEVFCASDSLQRTKKLYKGSPMEAIINIIAKVWGKNARNLHYLATVKYHCESNRNSPIEITVCNGLNDPTQLKFKATNTNQTEVSLSYKQKRFFQSENKLWLVKESTLMAIEETDSGLVIVVTRSPDREASGWVVTKFRLNQEKYVQVEEKRFISEEEFEYDTTRYGTASLY